MNADPYFWYVLAAYLATASLIGGLTAFILFKARQTRRQLEREDARR